ncbi:MAG: DHH family phosphoesterase [Patescibacteria group bacterium]|jgi:nanoRNase/pAp phosphatase (c-di-AMP/oligoRNAs hydrolase)
MPQQQQQPLNEIKQKITSANSIAILLPQQHTIDNVAAGLALYLTLKQNYQDKNIIVATSTEVTVAFQRLYAVGDIKNELGSKNLVIALKTAYDNIEKVSYDNENNHFNLIVETKNGVPSLTKDQVDFFYRGVAADLLITVGLTTPEDVGSLLVSEPKLFEDREIVTIAHQPTATSFGTTNFHDPSASGVSEMVTKLLRFMRAEVDGDIATNLLAGLESATNNFMSQTGADTFAAASWCMRAGGRRNHLGRIPAQTVQSPFTPGFFPPRPQPFQSSQGQPFPQKQEEAKVVTEESRQVQDDASGVPTPQKDWYEPKIFKSTNRT